MKSNTKKRLIAFMLCMVLVLSSATSAFADEQQDMDSTNQIETTAEAETETQEAVADEPMVTSLDASSEEQQPVADEPAVTAEEPAAENEPVITPDENSSKENKAEDEISIQTTINGTTITMSGPRSSFPEGNNYEISASELNEEKTKDVEIALKKKEDETNTKIATYKAYDIKLLVDGIETQPTGDVNVKFEGGEVKENLTNAENVEVYHVDESNQTANDISGITAEDTVTMTTNHFSTYVITTTKDGGVDITVQHYLQNTTTSLYRDSTVHLNKGQEIKDLSSPSNYTAQKVVKVNKDGSVGDELSGDEVITANQTYRVYYTATTGTSDESVQMFDYQVKGNNNASINNSSNYDKASSKTTRFASGLIKDQYNDNKYDTTVKINESDIYINTWDKDSRDWNVNYVNGSVFGNNNATTGIITGVDFSTGALNMGTNSSGQLMYEPGFFTKDTKPGKQVLSGYKLSLSRSGDTYKLTDVKKDNESVLRGYTTEGANFYPLDSIRNDNPDSANDNDHNDYFGMRYDIEFKIGDYLGDLNYTFKGDDDLWAVLDAKENGGNVVIDLGGIHSALDKSVDLWKTILRNDNYEPEDRKNLSEDERNKTHTLTILYMERGAYASNCQMEFTLPNSKVINSEEAAKSLTFRKTTTSGNALAGATFTLYASDGTAVKDTAVSSADGTVTFGGLYSGTYIIKETSAPNGYIASKDTWTVNVTASEATMYKTGDSTQTSVTSIANSTEKEEAEKNLTNGKTAEIIDESSRIFQINLDAATTGRNPDVAAQKASVVLVLDASDSLGSDGLTAVKDSAKSFISTLKESSPESEVSIVWFSGDEGSSGTTTVRDYCTLTDAGVNTLNAFIDTKTTTSGGTPMGDALSQAYTKIKAAHNSNKYVLLFTDGMPGHYPESGTAKENRNQRFNCMSANKACNHAEKIKAENDGNAILYTVGYFKTGRDSTESQIYWHRGDSDSSYYYDNTGHVDKNWRYTHDTLTTDTAFLSDYIATKASGNNQYAFTTSDKEQLTGIFQALAGKIGDLYSVTPTKIVDTIDARFKLTEASRIALVGNVNGVKNTETNTTTYTKADNTIVITENANGTTTITWTGDAAKIRNAEDPTNPGWHVNFQIQAKDDFIGGNVIPTNGSDSGIYLNDETTNTKPFPQPSVNVKLLNHTLDNKEITFYKNETITSNNFAKELLGAYKVIELDGKTSLSLGDAGIPELTDEEIKSLRTGTSIEKDYSYPNTNDIVGQFKFEFVPDQKGQTGDHEAEVTGNTVEQYTLIVTFIPKTPEERNTILTNAGKTIDPPQTEEKTINDSVLKEITVPKGGKIIVDQSSVEGIYKVNVFAIYKQSTSVNPTTNEHPKLAGAKFSLTGTKSKNVYYGLSDDTGLVKWYEDEKCTKLILFNRWVTDSYTFKEIKAPEGYSLNPTHWTIKKTSGTTIVSKVEITGEDSTSTNCTYYFNNTPLYSLPSTGGTGIYLYMIGGMMLMLIAVWILYKNKCWEVLER
jgi:fibro-slime domain-containing protein/LPXTG-motif cell wall-anchored protein